MKKLHIDILPYELHFKQPAGTSRGTYTTRKVWYLRAAQPDERYQPSRENLLAELMHRNARPAGVTGWGECAPLPQLSCDDVPDYESILRDVCDDVEATGTIPYDYLRSYPSMLFGLETALRNLESGGGWHLWASNFSHGKEGITTNGLVWMGTAGEMQERIEHKLKQGFHCIKLKIGAIDFEEELKLLHSIRQRFSPEQVELRVDANGAFSPEEAPYKLERLAEYQLHSIEQPIAAGNWEAMATLCRTSPLPIALDEELIQATEYMDKIKLLDTIHPQYIVLKPSLHGGISGTEEWIDLADERGINSWITSALESNIGLNAIAQWCATLQPTMPQGLGTGMLYTDNVESPLTMEGEKLWFRQHS